MIKTRKTNMSRKSKPVEVPSGDPAEAVAQTPQPQAEGYQNLDNQYEAAGFAVSTIFKNWKKALAIVLAILLMTGIILLLLLPGYKCQSDTRTFEKTPVELPGKKHRSADSN